MDAFLPFIPAPLSFMGTPPGRSCVRPYLVGASLLAHERQQGSTRPELRAHRRARNRSRGGGLMGSLYQVRPPPRRIASRSARMAIRSAQDATGRLRDAFRSAARRDSETARRVSWRCKTRPLLANGRSGRTRQALVASGTTGVADGHGAEASDPRFMADETRARLSEPRWRADMMRPGASARRSRADETRWISSLSEHHDSVRSSLPCVISPQDPEPRP